jgi:flagellar biosynthetic protein FliS
VNQQNDTSHQYRQVQVETSTTLDLVLMAHDRIIDNLNEALAALEVRPKSYDVFSDKLTNSQQIVEALDDGLDDSQGELPALLVSFYSFLRGKLIESNMDKSSDGVKEIISVVEQIRESWRSSTEYPVEGKEPVTVNDDQLEINAAR